jgi:predicted ester cyclase
MTTIATSAREIGPHFFKEQDRLHGGPNPDLCAPGYVAIIGSNPPMPLSGHQGFATAFYTGFPDITHTIEDVIAEEGKVAVRVSFTGTHTGDFMGLPATNKSVRFGAMMFLQIENGQVTILHGQFDQMGLMRQLGALG